LDNNLNSFSLARLLTASSKILPKSGFCKKNSLSSDFIEKSFSYLSLFIQGISGKFSVKLSLENSGISDNLNFGISGSGK
jgi:hypothetical protein